MEDNAPNIFHYMNDKKPSCNMQAPNFENTFFQKAVLNFEITAQNRIAQEGVLITS